MTRKLSTPGTRAAPLSSTDWADSIPVPQPWSPKPHQTIALKRLLGQACLALWLDPGAGKTSTVLAAFKVLKKERMVKRMLVVAPLRPCYLVWPREQEKWEDFAKLKIVVLHGSDKDDLVDEDADVYVVNPDGLPWLVSSGFFDRVRPDILCVDESSQFKNTQTRRFKLLKPHLGKFKRRWTLTGTPSSNGYLDVFGQAYITDGGNALGPYITRYRSEYFAPSGYGGYDWKLQDGAEERIQEKLKPIVCRIDMGDYVKVPTILPNPIYVDLPNKVRKLYDRLEDEMFIALSGGRTVTALNAAAAMSKCAQIACGGIYLDYAADPNGLLRTLGQDRETVHLHTIKVDAVADLHEELGYKPLLVAYNYHHDLERLRKKFGKDVPVLGAKGSGTLAMRYDADLERKWNRGELPLLFGHPASIGHGLNLQEAGNDVCWHSMTYDLELYEQFNKRVARQGNKHSVCRIHQIIARSTTDEAMLHVLTVKGASQNALLNALRDYRAHRTPTTTNRKG